MKRRRRLPFVALGGLLVIVCVLAYAYGAVRLGDRMQVLAVAHPVSAGQPITAADLTEASAARDSRVRLIPAADAARVIGRTAVVPLVAGMLLTPELIGDAAFPPPGKVAASLALKPGQYPQGLAPGARVVVFVTTTPQAAGQPAPSASSTAEGRAPASLPAVVLGVDLAGDGQGATVVTLLLDAADGPRLAAAPPGSVVLMQTPPQGG